MFLVHLAASRHCVEIVQGLLHAKININTRDCKGRTPIMTFGSHLTSFPSDEDPRRIENRSEIHPRRQILQMLIHGGADLYAVDRQGRTALHAVATSMKYARDLEDKCLVLDALKLLVDSGADSEAKDAEGITATDILAGYKAHEIIELWVEYLSQRAEQSK